jgi:hypothetical protein
VLRWRGFRGSNGITLAFRELRCDSKEVERLTRKRKKRAVLPLHPELFLALDRRGSRPSSFGGSEGEALLAAACVAGAAKAVVGGGNTDGGTQPRADGNKLQVDHAT